MAMDVRFTDDRDAIDLELAWRWISEESYWGRGQTLAAFKKAVEHSACVSGHAEGGMVAFARVVTDQVTFAWLCDVWVDGEHRGLGLGKRLVDFALRLPQLRDVRRWMLVTRDAHGLYRPSGFATADSTIGMERLTPREQEKRG